MDQARKNKRRLFFALWPNAVESKAFYAWLLPLRELCGGRAMRPDTLHATLAFLGDVDEHRLEELKLIAQGINFQHFELIWSVARLWQHNHIVYAAPAVIPLQLEQLEEGLVSQLRNHGFHLDDRNYQPHVTLLRNASWNDTPLPSKPEVCWLIDQFVLVQSLRDEQGAFYERLARFPASS